MTDIDTSEPVPVDFEGDAFDEWIGGATVSKRSVLIYSKPGLYAEYEELERELERIEAENKAGGEMAGSGVGRVNERMAELYHEWRASKSTWTVRALDDDAIKAIEAECGDAPVAPDPLTPPAPLPPKPTNQQSETHGMKMRAYYEAKPMYDEAVKVYEKAQAEHTTKVNLHILAEAVERIEFADGKSRDGITVDQLLALKKKLGEVQLLKLIFASQLAMTEETEIPAPFSQGSSETDQT